MLFTLHLRRLTRRDRLSTRRWWSTQATCPSRTRPGPLPKSRCILPTAPSWEARWISTRICASMRSTTAHGQKSGVSSWVTEARFMPLRNPSLCYAMLCTLRPDLCHIQPSSPPKRRSSLFISVGLDGVAILSLLLFASRPKPASRAESAFASSGSVQILYVSGSSRWASTLHTGTDDVVTHLDLLQPRNRDSFQDHLGNAVLWVDCHVPSASPLKGRGRE